MDLESSSKKTGCYHSITNGHTEAGNSASSSSVRNRSSSQSSFIHDSLSSSLLETYIPWQTLSTDVTDLLRLGSVKINKSNRLEWAQTIKEEVERAPLLDKTGQSSSSGSTSAISAIRNKNIAKTVQQGISWKVAAFILINSALGSGILNYPAAYDRVGGIFIATLVQLVLLVILGATMFILAYSSDQNRDATYHDVLLSICGKRAQQLSALSIMLTCYGICITFLIVIGDQYDRSYMHQCYWFIDRKFTITVTALGMILPMCYFQRLEFLRYAGTLGVFSMFYIVFLNVYQYFKLDIEVTEIKTRPTSGVTMLAVVPVMCFAYQCHELIVPVYACMEDRSMKAFSKVTALSLGVLFVLYCTAGTFGYLTFGDRVSPDIMQLYDARDPFVLIGICSLIVKMITTYPPLIVCGRGAIDGLYTEFMKLSTNEVIEGERCRRIVITSLWFVSSLIIAVFTPHIGVIIELLGSLASANVFIFPSLCLIAIARRPEKRSSILKTTFYYAFALTLIGIGLTMFVIVLYQTFVDVQLVNEVSERVLC